MVKMVKKILYILLTTGVSAHFVNAQSDTTRINYELSCNPKNFDGKLKLLIINPYKNLKLDINGCTIGEQNAMLVNVPAGHYTLNGVVGDKVIYSDKIKLWKNQEVSVEVDTTLPVYNVYRVFCIVFTSIGLTSSLFTMPYYIKTKQMDEASGFSVMMTVTGTVMFGRYFISKQIALKKYRKNIEYYRKLRLK